MKKILIIDDSKVAVEVLKNILTDTFEVISAGCGKEGLILAKTEQPALIMLDIEMPEMDGFEVLHNLKEEKLTKAIPVIFLTGVVDSKCEEKGFLCGAVDYIVKPYKKNVVKARVMTHINLAEYSKKIEEQLNIDTLTDVYNRRGLEKYLEELAVQAVEEKFVFNCVMLDIDYFKKINDTYGHLQGDCVLRKMAAVLKKCVPRDRGYVARYGGEEFTIILPGMSRQEVKNIVESIFWKIKEARIPNEKSNISPFLTFSAGGAGRMLTRKEDAWEIVRISDKMLYKSKKEGRNRFTWYQEEGNE